MWLWTFLLLVIKTIVDEGTTQKPIQDGTTSSFWQNYHKLADDLQPTNPGIQTNRALRFATEEEVTSVLTASAQFRDNLVNVFGNLLHMQHNTLPDGLYAPLYQIYTCLRLRRLNTAKLLPALDGMSDKTAHDRFVVLFTTLRLIVPRYLESSVDVWVDVLVNNPRTFDLNVLLTSPNERLVDILHAMDMNRLLFYTKPLTMKSKSKKLNNLMGEHVDHVIASLSDGSMTLSQHVFTVLILHFPLDRATPHYVELESQLVAHLRTKVVNSWVESVSKLTTNHYEDPFSLVRFVLQSVANHPLTDAKFRRLAKSTRPLITPPTVTYWNPHYAENLQVVSRPWLDVVQMLDGIQPTWYTGEVVRLKNDVVKLVKNGSIDMSAVTRGFVRYTYENPTAILIALLTRMEFTIADVTIATVVSSLRVHLSVREMAQSLLEHVPRNFIYPPDLLNSFATTNMYPKVLELHKTLIDSMETVDYNWNQPLEFIKTAQCTSPRHCILSLLNLIIDRKDFPVSGSVEIMRNLLDHFTVSGVPTDGGDICQEDCKLVEQEAQTASELNNQMQKETEIPIPKLNEPGTYLLIILTPEEGQKPVANDTPFQNLFPNKAPLDDLNKLLEKPDITDSFTVGFNVEDYPTVGELLPIVLKELSHLNDVKHNQTLSYIVHNYLQIVQGLRPELPSWLEKSTTEIPTTISEQYNNVTFPRCDGRCNITLPVPSTEFLEKEVDSVSPVEMMLPADEIFDIIRETATGSDVLKAFESNINIVDYPTNGRLLVSVLKEFLKLDDVVNDKPLRFKYQNYLNHLEGKPFETTSCDQMPNTPDCITEDASDTNPPESITNGDISELTTAPLAAWTSSTSMPLNVYSNQPATTPSLSVEDSTDHTNLDNLFIPKDVLLLKPNLTEIHQLIPNVPVFKPLIKQLQNPEFLKLIDVKPLNEKPTYQDMLPELFEIIKQKLEPKEKPEGFDEAIDHIIKDITAKPHEISDIPKIPEDVLQQKPNLSNLYLVIPNIPVFQPLITLLKDPYFIEELTLSTIEDAPTYKELLPQVLNLAKKKLDEKEELEGAESAIDQLISDIQDLATTVQPIRPYDGEVPKIPQEILSQKPTVSNLYLAIPNVPVLEPIIIQLQNPQFLSTLNSSMINTASDNQQLLPLLLLLLKYKIRPEDKPNGFDTVLDELVKDIVDRPMNESKDRPLWIPKIPPEILQQKPQLSEVYMVIPNIPILKPLTDVLKRPEFVKELNIPNIDEMPTYEELLPVLLATIERKINSKDKPEGFDTVINQLVKDITDNKPNIPKIPVEILKQKPNTLELYKIIPNIPVFDLLIQNIQNPDFVNGLNLTKIEELPSNQALLSELLKLSKLKLRPYEKPKGFDVAVDQLIDDIENPELTQPDELKPPSEPKIPEEILKQKPKITDIYLVIPKIPVFEPLIQELQNPTFLSKLNITTIENATSYYDLLPGILQIAKAELNPIHKPNGFDKAIDKLINQILEKPSESVPLDEIPSIPDELLMGKPHPFHLYTVIPNIPIFKPLITELKNPDFVDLLNTTLIELTPNYQQLLPDLLLVAKQKLSPEKKPSGFDDAIDNLIKNILDNPVYIDGLKIPNEVLRQKPHILEIHSVIPKVSVFQPLINKLQTQQFLDKLNLQNIHVVQTYKELLPQMLDTAKQQLTPEEKPPGFDKALSLLITEILKTPIGEDIPARNETIITSFVPDFVTGLPVTLATVNSLYLDNAPDVTILQKLLTKMPPLKPLIRVIKNPDYINKLKLKEETQASKTIYEFLIKILKRIPVLVEEEDLFDNPEEIEYYLNLIISKLNNETLPLVETLDEDLPTKTSRYILVPGFNPKFWNSIAIPIPPDEYLEQLATTSKPTDALPQISIMTELKTSITKNPNLVKILEEIPKYDVKNSEFIPMVLLALLNFQLTVDNPGETKYYLNTYLQALTQNPTPIKDIVPLPEDDTSVFEDVFFLNFDRDKPPVKLKPISIAVLGSPTGDPNPEKLFPDEGVYKVINVLLKEPEIHSKLTAIPVDTALGDYMLSVLKLLQTLDLPVKPEKQANIRYNLNVIRNYMRIRPIPIVKNIVLNVPKPWVPQNKTPTPGEVHMIKFGSKTDVLKFPMVDYETLKREKPDFDNFMKLIEGMPALDPVKQMLSQNHTFKNIITAASEDFETQLDVLIYLTQILLKFPIAHFQNPLEMKYYLFCIKESSLEHLLGVDIEKEPPTGGAPVSNVNNSDYVISLPPAGPEYDLPPDDVTKPDEMLPDFAPQTPEYEFITPIRIFLKQKDLYKILEPDFNPNLYKTRRELLIAILLQILKLDLLKDSADVLHNVQVYVDYLQHELQISTPRGVSTAPTKPGAAVEILSFDKTYTITLPQLDETYEQPVENPYQPTTLIPKFPEETPEYIFFYPIISLLENEHLYSVFRPGFNPESYPTKKLLLISIMKEALMLDIIQSNSEIQYNIKCFLLYLEAKPILPELLDGNVHNNTDTFPSKEIPSSNTLPKFEVNWDEPPTDLNNLATLVPDFPDGTPQFEFLNPIKMLLQNTDIYPYMGPNFDPRVHPTRRSLLIAILETVVKIPGIERDPLTLHNIQLLLKHLEVGKLEEEEVANPSDGGVTFPSYDKGYMVHLPPLDETYQQPPRDPYNPAQLLPDFPENTPEYVFIYPLKSLCENKDLYSIIFSNFDPSRYPTKRDLLIAIFIPLSKLDIVVHNPEVLYNVKLYLQYIQGKPIDPNENVEDEPEPPSSGVTFQDRRKQYYITLPHLDVSYEQPVTNPDKPESLLLQFPENTPEYVFMYSIRSLLQNKDIYKVLSPNFNPHQYQTKRKLLIAILKLAVGLDIIRVNPEISYNIKAYLQYLQGKPVNPDSYIDETSSAELPTKTEEDKLEEANAQPQTVEELRNILILPKDGADISIIKKSLDTCKTGFNPTFYASKMDLLLAILQSCLSSQEIQRDPSLLIVIKHYIEQLKAERTVKTVLNFQELFVAFKADRLKKPERNKLQLVKDYMLRPDFSDIIHPFDYGSCHRIGDTLKKILTRMKEVEVIKRDRHLLSAIEFALTIITMDGRGQRPVGYVKVLIQHAGTIDLGDLLSVIKQNEMSGNKRAQIRRIYAFFEKEFDPIRHFYNFDPLKYDTKGKALKAIYDHLKRLDSVSEEVKRAIRVVEPYIDYNGRGREKVKLI